MRRWPRRGAPGPYQTQAAINAVHSDAPSAQDTDWPQIVQLYDQRYYLFHAIRADLLRRLGRASEAAQAYDEAIRRTDNAAERAFLLSRREELRPADGSVPVLARSGVMGT